MKKIILSLGIALLVGCGTTKAPRSISIIPAPASMTASEGAFDLKQGATIGISDTSLRAVAEYLALAVNTNSGLVLSTSNGATGDVVISLGLKASKPEAYTLSVDKYGVRIECADVRGAIMAVATLVQLLPQDAKSGAALPYVMIQDEPRFDYRGLMLDVSRHFQDKEAVKHVLDIMARYKLNKFHWHLTDDQGWRVEIKQYPELTGKGAWRTWNWQDKQCMTYAKELDNPDFNIPEKYMKIQGTDTLYGGFYTQQDIREVVAYAAARGIDVLPEVDMPGHLMAAILGYPYLSCKGEAKWGASFSDPLCVGNDDALQFVKNVYTEIASLFPYQYMHLGADEVEKTNWKACPKCKARIKSEKLKSVDQLQAWFVHDMERHFNSLGKKLIGWDEIIEGGLSPSATIMWWRDWAPKAVPEATAAGNKVIMSPCFSMYLDAWESKDTFRDCYNFEPVLKGLNEKQAANIMGVQGNLWCETIPSMRRIENQYFPRVLAVAELGWSEPTKKNWDEFFTRVVREVEYLDAHSINYRIPDITGFENINVFTDTISVNAKCSFPNITIRYTTDGSFPTAASPILSEPLHIDKTTKFIFRGFRPDGTGGEMYHSEFRKESFAKPVGDIVLSTGLAVKQYEYKGKTCSEIQTAPLTDEFIVDSLNMSSELKGWVSLVCEGYITVPSDSVYTFALKSNDGSMLYVDDKMLIDNDKPHGDKEVTAQKALARGLHKVRVEFFDMNNGGCLRLKINGKVHRDFMHRKPALIVDDEILYDTVTVVDGGVKIAK